MVEPWAAPAARSRPPAGAAAPSGRPPYARSSTARRGRATSCRSSAPPPSQSTSAPSADCRGRPTCTGSALEQKPHA
eukprot:9475546-Pyramimonas_sp.AAC.1